MGRLQYLDYNKNDGRCRHVILSDRAYASVVSEVLKNGENETGGVLLGNIYNNIWYVVDAVDPGLSTTNLRDYFQWDADYVNHLVDRLGAIYHYPVSILGFWHRHPGVMDFFSPTDENTIRSHLRGSRFGLLSMLVNVDPDLRMTFYYCHEEKLIRVRYDHGDEYFLRELLQYASPERLAENIGTKSAKEIHVLPNRVLRPEQLPRSITPGEPDPREREKKDLLEQLEAAKKKNRELVALLAGYEKQGASPEKKEGTDDGRTEKDAGRTEGSASGKP